jgi:pimeloyl-ACP methyl ester carboxylesterase
LQGIMLEATPIRAESPRYGTSLLFLPELWAPGRIWLPVASFLGHRGWEGQLVELRQAGGLEERIAGVADLARRLPAPPVLIGHGAGGVVALEAARTGPAVAALLVAPLDPGSAPVRVLTRRWGAVTALLLGRRMSPPDAAAFGSLPASVAAQLDADTTRAVLDIVRGHALTPVGPDIPVLVAGGARDPLLPADAAAALAGRLAAEHLVIPDAAHWPLVESGWRGTVDLLHRWLVRRLGEPFLEFHAEAMAERDADQDDSDEE